MIYKLLFLAFLAVSPLRAELTEEETNTIDGIAMMCPVLGGLAVFMARAMQASYLGTVYYDDIALCAKQDIAYLTTRGGPKVDTPTILPNPNNGYANIVLPEALTSELKVEIIDLTGKTVLSVTVAAGTKSQFFDLTGIPNGTYLYRTVGNTGNVTNGKLILAKP